MSEENLYSIRMHASSDQGHLSGAERIVTKKLVPLISEKMVSRVFGIKNKGFSMFNIQVDALEQSALRNVPLLSIRTVHTKNTDTAGEEVHKLLLGSNVSDHAAGSAMKSIRDGAAPTGGNMRGGMIVHSQSGERLEPDRERGVRVSRMDYTAEMRNAMKYYLMQRDIFHSRVMEAAVLASKAAAVPGILAEFCISDDPDYTTGYVASSSLGYVRIENIKKKGETFGGRAFFVEHDENVAAMIEELETVPYLITEFADV